MEAVETHLFFWPLVFNYLGPEDLTSVASVCLTWWKFVFRGGKATARKFLECQDLTLVNTGRLFQKVPLKLFSRLYSIDLSRTCISSKNFLQLVSTAKRLGELNIQACAGIEEQALFKAKSSCRFLKCINISHNEQFGILAIACLCSMESLQEICARGINLEYREILFLSKTFPRLGNGLDLETDSTDGDYFFDAVDIASDFDVLEDSF